MHTAKGAQLCTMLPPAVAVGFFAVWLRVEAHGKEKPLPWGLEGRRTAKSGHGKEGQRTAKHGARQRWAQRTAKLGRTAKPLPCDFRSTHGKVSSAHLDYLVEDNTMDDIFLSPELDGNLAHVDYLVEDNAMDDICLSPALDGNLGMPTFQDYLDEEQVTEKGGSCDNGPIPNP
ncbi:hypothetical protein QYE76_048626 [Lolium multiflorum]|uniref:Uncharacterized protein n=1 Tax=Lolium multiflorum TaxID=4521 RepID=A0AAD8SN01_LOLMU|nr:hypothetical protein QYE76_048626 [Lolium multiflorum]